MPPLISVLVPAFDAAAFVRQAVGSVLAQTFASWELIAVDDASSDTTLEVLRSFSDPRIRVEQNAANLGMTANWNRCLSLASGTLVLKLDADDALKPDVLERLAAAFHDDRVIAAGARSLQCDEALEPFDGIQGDDAMFRSGINPYRDVVLPGERWYAVAAGGHQLWSSSAFMYRRDAIAGWDERFGCASDTELMLRALESGRPVAHFGGVGALYRVRAGSVSDEYRSRGLLTWEGVVVNLMTLARTRSRTPLPRSLRMRYVRLWRQWSGRRTVLPEPIEQRLRDAMREVPPPPRRDVLMTLARDALSAS